MTPQELATEAACFSCIPRGLSPAVITYLLNRIAATGFTPEQLMEQAKCFACIPPGSANAVNAFLLNYIADNCGGGGGSGFIEAITSLNAFEVNTPAGFSGDLSFTNLSSVTTYFFFTGSNISSIDFPSLVSVGQVFSLLNLPFIPSVNIPNLTTIGGNLDIENCASLADVNFGNWLPSDGKDVVVYNCALTDVSVNHILARCVANPAYVTGYVDTTGGTSSAPTGQGIADAATLTGRGVTVNTN